MMNMVTWTSIALMIHHIWGFLMFDSANYVSQTNNNEATDDVEGSQEYNDFKVDAKREDYLNKIERRRTKCKTRGAKGSEFKIFLFLSNLNNQHTIHIYYHPIVFYTEK